MALKFKQRPFTDHIVVHCAATQNKPSIDRAVIAQWHRAQGWMDIGYHFVIKTDGTVEVGRDVDVIGSHVKGYNNTSIGICLVGGINAEGKSENNFTKAQFESLRNLIVELKLSYPDAKVLGHRDFAGVHKDCPCFDVTSWLNQNDTVKTKNVIVKKGDTLYGIAQSYGVTVEALTELNNLVSDQIKIGEILKVPIVRME
jgi:N-acetyl-anhydromuramyl-L-alanine amidase AmpD